MKQLTLPLFLLGSTLILSCKNNTEEKKNPEKENTTISVERLQDSSFLTIWLKSGILISPLTKMRDTSSMKME